MTDHNGWFPMDSAPRDGTHIVAVLHRGAFEDTEGTWHEAFSEIREIWYRPFVMLEMQMPWHAGDPFDSRGGIAAEHMGEGIPVAWRPRLKLPRALAKSRRSAMTTDANRAFEEWNVHYYKGSSTLTVAAQRAWLAAVAWATARERERRIDDAKNGAFPGFVNYGHDLPDTSDLDCPHCGGSGHKDDVRPAPPTPADDSKVPDASGRAPITLIYRDYRGDVAECTITPKDVWFGGTESHPEPQWMLTAFDHDNGAERHFALKDFRTAALQPELSEPLIKTVERILGEHGAWISAPNPEVTHRIALATAIAVDHMHSDPEPVAYITKAGLANWMKGSFAEAHVLLREGNANRVPLFTSPEDAGLDTNADSDRSREG